ncbi:uncharacterized protein LOC129613349 [Condylostylus longicornis]|uniref:uncharacterized protein LOC129613349 n=1 Tax=Condylostylus longicornis TaxID=2530218 RepID=UPI00244DBA3A|nr:uncharacterized protein LOC129613349 [Condylostylus longicornis]
MFLKLYSKFVIIILLFFIISLCDFGQSQIVTPERLNKNYKTHGNTKNNTRVEVTDKNLMETKALRDEISRAITENRYHINLEDNKKSKNSTIPVNHSSKNNGTIKVKIKPSRKPNETLVGQATNGTNFDNPTGRSSYNDDLDKIIAKEIDPLGINNDKIESSGIKANTVHSNLAATGDEDRQKFLLEDFLPKHFVDREVLTVTSIEEDPKFILGDGVREWKILRTESENYWIGLKAHHILLISDGKYEEALRVDFGYPIEAFETFSFWNTTSDRSTGVILISIGNSISWIESKSLELIWTWNIGKIAKIMKFYQIDGREYLAILAVTEDYRKYSINIYEFIEDTKEFWIIQMIPLKYPTDEMIFLDTGREAVLAVTQENDVLVYDYNPDAEFRYELAEKFTSEDLKSITAFKMGGYSYLAISGKEPKILRYYRGDFIPQTLFGGYFKLVHRYFPIPARTYRDDLILLVQHIMEFAGHSLTVLEALVWNGQSFEAAGDIPCTLGSETYHFGVSCMLDLERESGIAGAAIIDGGRNISIIVPREDAPSGVFTINTILKERKTEVQELEELFEFLNSTATEQEEILENTNSFIENSDGNLLDLDLDYFSATELLFDGDIEEIFVNDIKWTEEDENIDVELLIKDLEELSEDIKNLEEQFSENDTNMDSANIENEGNDDCFDSDVKVKRSIKEFDYIDLELHDVIIENLIVDLINTKPIPKLIENGILNFNGTIIFENGLTVKESFNENSAEQRTFARNNETLELNELKIDGDIEFEFINGIRWTEFLSKVTLITFPAKFNTLIVEGDVEIDQGLQIDFVNNIEFPYGFLWSSGPRTNVITARKNFTGLLEANAMDTAGLINGIDPLTFVTLSTNQTITGKTTFRQLEVSELLEVNGTISGRGLKDFLSNPTILETTVINAACRFNVLEINGTVKVVEKFNGQDLDVILENIIYKNEIENDSIVIESKKIFNRGIEFTDNIEIKSNNLNDIPINNFVTKDTVQELEFNKIVGDIEIENLELSGTFDSINIQNLFENTTMIDGNQLRNSTLIVENPEFLNISELIVLNLLNGESINDFVNINEDMEFENFELDTIIADLVETQVDIEGSSGILNGIELRELNVTDNELNIIKNNTNELYFEELTIENDLDIINLNGFEFSKAIQLLERVHDIPFMVKQGLITIRELIVNGNIDINGTINGKPFNEEILSRVIWLNRENQINNPIIFKNSINFENDVKINGLLNNENFQSFINDIVWKNNSKFLNTNNKNQLNSIKSEKTFINPIEILQNAQITRLNQGETKNLARTNVNKLNFKGNLHIFGNLEIENLNIGESFNDIESEVFTDLCRYDENLGCYILGNNEIEVKDPITIDNLNIIGKLNGFENCTNFINNLVYKDEPTLISGEIIFEQPIEFKGNIHIDILNGLNLVNAFENIVYDNENEIIEIHSPVIFNEPVIVDFLEVKEELHTSNIGGCDIIEWKLNSVSLDEDLDIPKLYFSSGSLDSNDLHAKYFNDYDLENLVTLHTYQNFTHEIHVSELFLTGSLTTINLINDKWDIKAEMENTVMKNRLEQRITSSITAKSFKILHDLQIDALVNEKKNISDVIHLESKTIELYSPVFFKNLTVPEVFTKDTISGFNFNEWYDESLWSSGRTEQTITGHWNIENLYVKGNIIGHDHYINNIPLDMIRGQLDGPTEDQQKQFKHITDDYNILCQKIQKIMKKSQNRIYFVKYFEESTKYKENGLINTINIFKHNETYYLLSNVDCYTIIYQWDVKNSKFVQINKFESGSVFEYIAISEKNGDLNLLTNSKENEISKCKSQGVKYWVFNSGNISDHGQFYGHFDSIYYDPNQNGFVYGISLNQNSVIKLNPGRSSEDIEDEIWELPKESRGLYRFLPDNTEFGAAISDGKRILIVNKNFKNSKNRKKRTIIKNDNISKLPKKNINITFESVKIDLYDILFDLVKNISNTIKALQQNSNFPNYQNITNEINENSYSQILNEKILDNLLMHQASANLETLRVYRKKLIKIITTGIMNIADNVIKNFKIENNEENLQIQIKRQEYLKLILNNLLNFLMNRLEFLKPLNINKNNFEIKDEIKTTTNNSNIQLERGIQFTPSIKKSILQRQQHQQQYSNITTKTTNPLFSRRNIEEYFHEPIIGRDISSGSLSNLLIADNNHIPDKISGEILPIKVSYKENQHTLYAIINSKNYEKRSNLDENIKDSIKIFFDIMQGHVFQTIESSNPRNLAVLNIRDETILGFVEGKNFIKLYIYRGIQGFVEFSHIKCEHKIEKLLSIALPKKLEFFNKNSSICPEFYFIAAGENYFSFYKAILAGTCTVEGDLKCNGWTED